MFEELRMTEVFREAWSLPFQRSEYPSTGKFYISEAGFDPRYRLAKARGQFKSYFDTSMKFKMWLGLQVEHQFLSGLEALAKMSEEEINMKFTGKPWLLGFAGAQVKQQVKLRFHGGNAYMDAYIVTREGKRIILEVKTTSKENAVPVDYNIWQLQGYMFAGKEQGYECDEGWLLYISREDGDMRPILNGHNIEKQVELNEIHMKLRQAYSEYKDLATFPPDEFWGVDLKKYYMPREFALWLLENYRTDEIIDCTGYFTAEEVEAEKLANDFLKAVKLGCEDDVLKGYKERLQKYYDLGYTEIPCELGCVKASRTRTENINVKEVKKVGLEIPAFLESHVKVNEYWRTNKKISE